MRPELWCVAGLALALASAAPALAQEAPDAAERPERFEEAGRMVDAYVLSNLQEQVGLSDEQYVKLLPLVKRLQQERRDFVRQRQEALRALRRGLGAAVPKEAELASLVESLRRLDAEEPAKLRQGLEAIDAELSVVQQARLRVFEVEVQRRIRELLLRARRERPERREPQPR